MQLLKLETILNVATMGYNVLWLEPHTLVTGGKFLHLIEPTSVGVCIECCDTLGWQIWALARRGMHASQLCLHRRTCCSWRVCMTCALQDSWPTTSSADLHQCS